MRNFFVVCLCCLFSLTAVADSATEGTRYGGTGASSEPWFEAIGLADGSVAIVSANFWSVSPTSIVFPTTLYATWNATAYEDCNYTFTVSQIGYDTWPVWVGYGDSNEDITANITSVFTGALTVTEHAWDNMSIEEPETPAEVNFLRGGDLSMVTYLEDWGTKFKYKNGTEGDVFDILEEYGVNFARLRIYNHPGTAVKHDGNTYRTPVKSPYNDWAGRPDYYAGPEDIISLAKRAKAHNMKICLSFHLSDYWTNATTQMIPAAWQEVTSNEVLGDSVYIFVKSVMERMKAQGTLPEYVSIGNESNYGILFNTLDGTQLDFGGHTDNIAQCVALFNRAYEAVKAVSPSSQVVIHHSYGHDGRIGICRNFFKSLKDNGCKFDVVGGSYYPYWASKQHSTDNTPTGMLAWAKDMEDNIGKPVLIMETGYSWTPYRPSGKNGGNYMGQLELNGDQYNEASEAGQEAFIKSLHEAIAKDENIMGYLYWDPVFVDQKLANYWTEVCWAEKYDESAGKWWQDGNVISNTTLFDYTGLPLSALYREIASLKPTTPSATEEMSTVNSQLSTKKFLRDGQLYIMYEGRMYDVRGTEVKEKSDF